jgi:hypothetical protein
MTNTHKDLPASSMQDEPMSDTHEHIQSDSMENVSMGSAHANSFQSGSMFSEQGQDSPMEDATAEKTLAASIGTCTKYRV